MFKTKKELIKERFKDGEDGDIQCGVEMGINISFESFAERVAFYKKYHGLYPYLRQCKPEIVKLFDDKYGFSDVEYNGLRGYPCRYHVFSNTYNLWLFDFCFGDIK